MLTSVKDQVFKQEDVGSTTAVVGTALDMLDGRDVGAITDGCISVNIQQEGTTEPTGSIKVDLVSSDSVTSNKPSGTLTVHTSKTLTWAALKAANFLPLIVKFPEGLPEYGRYASIRLTRTTSVGTMRVKADFVHKVPNMYKYPGNT